MHLVNSQILLVEMYIMAIFVRVKYPAIVGGLTRTKVLLWGMCMFTFVTPFLNKSLL